MKTNWGGRPKKSYISNHQAAGFAKNKFGKHFAHSLLKWPAFQEGYKAVKPNLEPWRHAPSLVLYGHYGDIFSSEFSLEARSLLSLDQRGLMYILQSKVFAQKISYKYGEFFLDHSNIISKKYYNLTIKLVLEVEPSWWDFF